MFVTAKIESFYCQLFKNTNIKFIKMKYHFEQVNLSCIGRLALTTVEH